MTHILALAAGGTGGHMFPAQSLAEEAKTRGWRVILLTDERGLRYTDGFPADRIVLLEAANPNVKGPVAKAQMAWAMFRGLRTARRALKQEKINAVVGFGGYPSAPGLFAARTLRLPFAVHEQNAVLGRVNRRAAPGADIVAHGFPRLDRLPEMKGQLVETGNPVRDAVRKAADIPYDAPRPSGVLRVLIFGGSQGAALFGRVFAPALASLPDELRARLEVTHQVPEADRETVAGVYEAAGIRAELAPFFTDLPERTAKSHYVISRSGASSVTEIAVIGRPALLVPLGIAMDDHQRINAETLVAAGAADLLLEAEATPEKAAAMLLPRLNDPDWLAGAANAARSVAPERAAEKLADLVAALLED
ncbi:UDP-N-acetylglucosamine--N-acetylmuramyl-(pentapeptide) pyrophosphoryl-undecaprenol N-acetylglucosamine transferase [Parvularcula marina]|nr:UDP-N-acetylglucosamine--N-acetylmuramyl-(pentapeptide) pyrophosphoryl-undecaprenol N-acetylglucosamine transferase [Parvularcula marina]